MNRIHALLIAILRIFHLQNRQEEIFRITRYLLTGLWNTFFGFFVYYVLYEIWGKNTHYLLLLIPSNILAITNAYIFYKLFVFKTRGNVIREYLKCYIVYGGAALISAGLMFLMVSELGIHPVLAQGLCIIIITVCSYITHRDFSFKTTPNKATVPDTNIKEN